MFRFFVAFCPVYTYVSAWVFVFSRFRPLASSRKEEEKEKREPRGPTHPPTTHQPQSDQDSQ